MPNNSYATGFVSGHGFSRAAKPFFFVITSPPRLARDLLFFPLQQLFQPGARSFALHVTVTSYTVGLSRQGTIGAQHMAHTAKLFRNGRTQAVRLPAEYRFEGSEVYVRRDPRTGDVILSRRPESWDDYFDLVKSLDIPEDFLQDRDRRPPQKRKLS
jgi:antitoxin VapB